MILDIELQTVLSVTTIVIGGFISLWQRSFSAKIETIEEKVEKSEVAAGKRWEKVIKDVEDIERQLQHTRETYVTNEQFEKRMNDLSKQFENRTVDLGCKMDKVLERISSCSIPAKNAEALLMRKVEP